MKLSIELEEGEALALLECLTVGIDEMQDEILQGELYGKPVSENTRHFAELGEVLHDRLTEAAKELWGDEFAE